MGAEQSIEACKPAGCAARCRQQLQNCEGDGEAIDERSAEVVDVAGGDKVPRKGGPGVTQADLLVINKVDLAEAVGADLGVMERDAERVH